MKTGYAVMDLMTNSPVKIDQETIVQKAAQIMDEKKVGSLIVMDGKVFSGIITEQDIAYKLVANDKKASETKVKEIMTHKEKVISIEPQQDIFEAIKLMSEQGIRRLPVMEDGQLKGLITRKDILKIEPTLFDITVDKIRIREEERKLTINPDNPYEDEED